MEEKDWGLFLLNFQKFKQPKKTFDFLCMEICGMVVSESVLNTDPTGIRQHAQKKGGKVKITRKVKGSKKGFNKKIFIYTVVRYNDYVC